jgi:flagellin
MGLRINTNVPALTAQRTLEGTTRRLGASYNKLSSGERIYRAGDDAAGLAISEKLKGHIRGLRQARRNANDTISLIQTAEGGMGEVTNIIVRMRELAVQAASDTIGDQERGYTDIEFQLLKEEIDRIARSTEYSGRTLLDGTIGPMEFQIGIHNNPVLDRIYYDGADVDSTITNLGLSGETISLKQGAQVSLDRLDRALDQIGAARAKLVRSRIERHQLLITWGFMKKTSVRQIPESGMWMLLKKPQNWQEIISFSNLGYRFWHKQMIIPRQL